MEIVYINKTHINTHTHKHTHTHTHTHTPKTDNTVLV